MKSNDSPKQKEGAMPREKKETKEAVNVPEPVIAIHGFKGFNKDLTCQGFQFTEGETFTHQGKASACNSGFHFCENPLDVFGYYAPGQSIFHDVTGAGQIDRHNEDSKVACTEIKIGASIKLHDFIGASVKFLFNRKYEETTSKHSEGYQSASSSTGDQSASSSTGDRSASSSTGYRSASSSTGDRSASSSTGYQSASSSTGDQSASSSTGYQSASSSTGDQSAAVCTGLESKAMAGKYSCIALAWWNKAEDRAEMRCAETGCGNGSDGKLKAEVWYRLDDQGQFMEAVS
jgi:hypothetical protein